MNTLKQTISTMLIISTVFLQLAPAVSVYAAEQGVQAPTSTQNTLPEAEIQAAVQQLIQKPKPEVSSTDWSIANWDEEVVLVTDLDAYNQQMKELDKKQQYDEMAKLKPAKHTLGDDVAMAYFGVPQEVQTLVHAYRKGRFDKAQLQIEIARFHAQFEKTVEKGRGAEKEPDVPTIDVRTAPPAPMKG